jgi:uncharacterized integral membrane protein (TIGR00698 family)
MDRINQRSFSVAKTKKNSFFILKIAYLALAILCLFPLTSSAIALLMGMIFSVVFSNPFLDQTRQLTPRLLQASVVGLGAGMNLAVIGQVGLEGIGYTAVGILSTLTLGLVMGRLFKMEEDTSLLITVGTAICGGSAIAAVASTIRAKSHEVSVALATVFFLNAMALFIFPGLGHFFNLSQTQFGLWSALAIHDTSSVVGSAIQYGSRAVEVATTVKLARALWIIPVSLAVGCFWNRKKKSDAAVQKKYPWFILGFLIAAALVTWIPALQEAGHFVNHVAKRTLVLTLFLIGSGLTRATMMNVGIKPFIHGSILWLIVGSTTLGAIQLGWIH